MKKWNREKRPRVWNTFVNEFRERFIPKIMRERREDEFMGLRQRGMTVEQYEVQFTKLSKYAPDAVNTEEKRRKRFEKGLIIEIQAAMATARAETYTEMVETTQKIKDRQNKLRKFQNTRRYGTPRWGNRQGDFFQGRKRQPPKGTSGPPQK